MLAERVCAALGDGWPFSANNHLRIHCKRKLFEQIETNTRRAFPDLDHVNPWKSWRPFEDVSLLP